MTSEGANPLGDFLRSRRARLQPAQAGLADTGRRRTPGLRRDEVAGLAGISVEWYVKIEQGRAPNPSADTLAALAGALRLTRTETRHLLRLGRAASSTAFVPETVPDALLALVRSLAQPAWVTGLRWDLLAWNAAAEALLGGMVETTGAPPNLLRLMMLDPRARALFGEGWPAEARRMLNMFRAVYDDRAGDPAFEVLVAEMLAGGGEFRAWWRAHDVAAPGSGRKVLHRPGIGATPFRYVTLQSNDNPDLRLSVLMPG